MMVFGSSCLLTFLDFVVHFFSFYKKHIKQMPLSCSTNPQHNQKAAHPDAVVLVDPDAVDGRFLCRCRTAKQLYNIYASTDEDSIHLIEVLNRDWMYCSICVLTYTEREKTTNVVK